LLMILLPQLTGNAKLDISDWLEGRVTVLILIASYVLSVAAGVPAYFVVRRYFQQTWRVYLAAAFLSGASAVPLTIAAVLLWGLAFAGAEKFSAVAKLFSSAGAQVVGASIGIGILFAPIGLLFWGIARPDRT
jgi:hypothetical protein